MTAYIIRRDGTVEERYRGYRIGRLRRPDPSGSTHARTPVWVFESWDHRVASGRCRGDLHAPMHSATIRRNEAAGKRR